MQFVMALACAGLTLISHRQAHLFWMYACLFMMGGARTYLWAASASFMPQLVSRSGTFQTAPSPGNTGSFQISAVDGPGGGRACCLRWTGSATWVYAFNVAAAGVCLLLLWLVRAHHKVAVKEPMSLKSVVAGLKFVYHKKVILGSITHGHVRRRPAGRRRRRCCRCTRTKSCMSGPNGLGWLRAALPLGSLLMSIILVHRPPLQKAGHTMLWAVAGFGLATIGFGYSRMFWFSFLMLFLCGVTDYISVVVRHTLVQLLTPDAMRGRVSAVNSLFIGTSNEMGEFESGLVAHYFGSVFAVVSGGVGTILVVIGVAILWPEIRKYGRLDT